MSVCKDAGLLYQQQTNNGLQMPVFQRHQSQNIDKPFLWYCISPCLSQGETCSLLVSTISCSITHFHSQYQICKSVLHRVWGKGSQFKWAMMCLRVSWLTSKQKKPLVLWATEAWNCFLWSQMLIAVASTTFLKRKTKPTNQKNKQRNRGWFVTETLRKPKVKNPKCAFHVEIPLEEIQIPIWFCWQNDS